MTSNDRNAIPLQLGSRGVSSDHDAFHKISIMRTPVPLVSPFMSQQALFTDHMLPLNQRIPRNTLVITNSDYRSDQQRLSGIAFNNEICLGLPANVSWDELLCERPSNVLYLNRLLDCTRALNREYKRRKKTPSQISSNLAKIVPVPERKSREKCTSKKSFRAEKGEVKIVDALITDQDSLENGNGIRDTFAGERFRNNEEKLSSSFLQDLNEPSTSTISNSLANCELDHRQQRNVINESQLVTKDGAVDANARNNEENSVELSKNTGGPFPAAEGRKKKKRKKNRDNFRECKKSENSCKSDDNHLQFENYYDEKRVQNGLDNGTMFQDIIRINPRNVKEAYINCAHDDNKDIFIDGVRDRNRSLEGDEVVVELYPQDKWKRYPDDETYQKCGKVVAISQRNHPRVAVGHLKMVYGTSGGIILWPRDSRLPKIRIAEHTCPPNFREQHQLHRNILFLGQIVSWDAVESAAGVVLRYLGDENSMDVESECILIENNLEMEPLENEAEITSWCSEISESEMALREDIRERCIFTIDPPSAKDLDDALSWRRLPNGNVEVGIHIADVTHYLLDGTPLDRDARKKATSVYLVDKVYHMLPSRLCETCSLLPGEDKLAFSVFIELNESVDVVDHRFCKTVLRSCAQLNYDHAQEIIDNGNNSHSLNETTVFPPIGNGYTAKDCVEIIWQLHSLAADMRRRRFAEGALRIDQPKLVFHLNESKAPTSYTLYEGRESNWLVEEFMLLANILAANKIREAFPSTSLLRHHAAPKEKSLSAAVKYLERVGIYIDTSSAGHIYKSMTSYECNDEIGIARMTVIMHLLVKPMMRARYICSESSANDHSESWHYALNTPFYTHFTSPIRRYADVVVHRLLASAIGWAEGPNWTSDDIQKIAINCNNKKNAAKKASERSTELFLRSYVERNGVHRERAVVTEVKEKFFDVISLSTRSVGRIYVNKIGGVESAEFNYGNGVPTLRVKWKTNESLIYVQIFSIVSIEIFCKKNDDKYSNNSLHYTLVQ